MDVHDHYFNKLLKKLSTLRSRLKKTILVENALHFGVLMLITVVIALLLESIFYFEPGTRILLLSISGFILVGGFSYLVLRPLYSLFFQKKSPDDITLALKVGDRFHQVRDKLADALQVFKKHESNPERYSLELVDASLAITFEEIKHFDFETVVEKAGIKKALKIGFISLLLTAGIFILFPSGLFNASFRLFHPTQSFAKNTGLDFEVAPGNLEVVKGESVEIQARISGAEISQLNLVFKKANSKDFERKELRAVVLNQFKYTLENLTDDVEYYVEVENKQSQHYLLSVVELPFVRNLQVKLRYPKYTGLGSQLLDENVGDLTALKGTTVELYLKTNKTVNSAEINFEDTKRIPLTINGPEITGRFVLKRSGHYHFSLIDKKGRQNLNPIEYRMEITEDQFPLVQITFPGQDVDLGEDMLIPLTVEAQDDFGLSKLRLGYKILSGGVNESPLQYIDLPTPKKSEDKLLINYTWQLAELEIFPEDVIAYFAEAFDNDRISGPKSSKSITYHVRFPSIYEMYDEIARGHEETIEQLDEMYDKSESLKEDLKQIVQEMKKEPELNWEEKQKVQEAVQSQEKMQQELQDIQERLDEMVNRMEQNDLLSMETLQKYQELQKLMEEMLTPELQEALRELQKSFDEVDPQKLKEAMEKFAASQEDFLKSIERTMNLLKKLQIEQKLDEAIRKAQDLLKRQEELNKQATDSPQKQNSSKYAQEQKGLRKDTGNLSENLEELKKRMSEFPGMPEKRIDAALNEINKNGLKSQMQQATNQFQQGDFDGAQKTGQQISQNLQELLETLQTAQQELSDQQKQEVVRALSQSTFDLLNLSKQQENLMNSTQGMDRNSPGMNETADQQQDLLSGLARTTNQLYELSQKTFFVTPEIGKALGKSMSGMRQSLQSLEARKSGTSLQGQGEAMAGLNEAVSQLRNSMKKLNGASSAIGFQEMMQRLTGMSEQQQGINQRTSEMGQKPGMSMEQQAAMSRLAAEQRAVQKSLEQLLKEVGNRGELLGDLNKVSEDMEKVVQELQKQNVNRSTLDRQKRILSRLLDAQRSMHNRDYSKKRRAETGKEYRPLSPEALPATVLSKKDRLRDELLKAMKEGYSKDFKELIRKYFEALNREQIEESLNN